MEYLIMVALVVAVGTLGWWLGARSTRTRRTANSAEGEPASAVESAPPPTTSIGGADNAPGGRIPLGKAFLLFVVSVFLIKALLFLVNLRAFGAADLNAPGVLLIFIGYLGETIGQSVWIFVWPLLYRIYLKVTGKPYSRTVEIVAMSAGGLLFLLGIVGSVVEGNSP